LQKFTESTNLYSPAGQILKHKYGFSGFKIIKYKHDVITRYTFYKSNNILSLVSR